MSAAGAIDVRGLVYHGPRRALTIDALRLEGPGEGEVLVRMVASGVCHSDLHVVDGEWRRPSELVLGHEGAGIVEALGPGVVERGGDVATGSAGLRVGDLVALAWTAPCGSCPACVRGEVWLCQQPPGAGHRLDERTGRLHRHDGSRVGAYSGIGTFCSHQVVAAEAAIPIDAGTPHGVAALIGCAASTGIGAVRNTAAVAGGESVVVVGLGGVGLSALLAALHAGADPVIAVDLEPAKRRLAEELGATATMGPADLTPLVARWPSGGADHVFECIGLSETARIALSATRAGGQCTLVGMAPMGDEVGVDIYGFVEDGKRLVGSNYGSSVPSRDFPAIARDVVAGRLPLERLISESIALEGVDAAFEAMRQRAGLRRIVHFDT